MWVFRWTDSIVGQRWETSYFSGYKDVYKRQDYEAEQKELKERAARLREELSKAQEATANAEKFMNVVRRHTTVSYTHLDVYKRQD